MGKIERYKKILASELDFYANYKYVDMPILNNQAIISQDNNIFILIVMGWHRKDYIHNLVFHIEIKEDKVVIHEDRTDFGMANELMEKGISKSDIILNYLKPSIKPNMTQIIKN